MYNKRKGGNVMEDIVILKCSVCGKIVEKITRDKECPTVCCGKEMIELKANSTDASQEKHVPVILLGEGKVTVKIGTIPHPMTPEHYIEFIYLVTDKKIARAELKPGDAPEATFALLPGEKVVKAYDYCNLHGLWVKEN
jgi:superoxide reductase